MLDTDAVQDRIFHTVRLAMEPWNRAELARKSGVPESTLATQISRGRFSFEALLRLCPVLGLSLCTLIAPGLEPSLEQKARAFDAVRKMIHAVEDEPAG